MYSYAKKGFVAAAIVALVASGVPAFAQTATTTSSTSIEQIQALLKQIQQLQAQIAELQKKQAAIQVEIKDTFVLLRDLREGMSGDEVRALQEILAADPDIYPEGRITGFFGPLTASAVRKFQAKHGLELAGVAGPKTRAKIQELLADNSKEGFKCRAWGHLIAPGLRNGTSTVAAKIDISNCGKIPPGIEKKLGDDWKKPATTTAALAIKEIEVDDVTDTEAEIEWETNRKTKGVVTYSVESDLDDGDTESSNSFNNNHKVELEDLDEDTKYYFQIVVTDESGITATSSIRSFTTQDEDEADDEDEEDDEDDDDDDDEEEDDED